MPDKPRPSSSSSSSAPPHRFSLGDTFMCYHAPSAGFYEAKIIGVKEDTSEGTGFYTVHYTGWGKRYDEKITFEESPERMYNLTLAEYTAKYGDPQAKTPKVQAPVKKRATSENRRKRSTRTPDDAPSSSGSSRNSIARQIVDPQVKKARLAFDRVSTDVNLTSSLKGILVDDYQAICNGFVTKIPAKFNIDRIVRDYLKTIPCRTEDLQNIDDMIIEYEETEVRVTNLALICTANGIKDYVNAICGSSTQLLYNQERAQNTELIRFKAQQMGLEANTATLNQIIARGFKHTQEYGIIHLVRLLSRLSELLPMNEWEPRLLHRIMIGIHDLVVFLNKNWRHYHQGMDMYVTSAEMKQSLIEMGRKAVEKKNQHLREDSEEF